MQDKKTYFFSWVRKGLGNSIAEKDAWTFGECSASVLERPEINIVAEYNAFGVDEESDEPVKMTHEKPVKFVGAGDILGINGAAISKVVPAPASDTFPVQFYPYIEFWEPDFPWRYSPAAPNGKALRPWIAMLVAKSSSISIKRDSHGKKFFTFDGSENDYKELFLNPYEIYKTAHAQGDSATKPLLSRIISLRNGSASLEPSTSYTAMLVPTFETGRLRGLDNDNHTEILAQMPAWEEDYASQKAKHGYRPFDFPVYYNWDFVSGEDTFDIMVEKLSAIECKKAGIDVDVAHMGEGLDYKLFENKPSRKSILLPAATRTLGWKEPEAFPSPVEKNEKVLYDNIKSLLSQNPVFQDNRAEISSSGNAVDPMEDTDDPMIVPPVYGARHAMSTGFGEKDKEWLDSLNLDINNRAVAGLGKKVVQNHQEEFVNRAWKQVEAVNALNAELYKRLLSLRANSSLVGKTMNAFGKDEKFIANMMQYLSTMKNAANDGVSLQSVLKDNDIPAGFASPSFRLGTRFAEKSCNIDSTSLMENIVRNQTYRFAGYDIPGSMSLEELEDLKNESFKLLISDNFKKLMGQFFEIDEALINESIQDQELDGQLLSESKVKKFVAAGFSSMEGVEFSRSYSSEGSPKDIYDVVFLYDRIYTDCFGPYTLVTAVGKTRPIYFANWDRIREEYLKHNSFVRNAVNWYNLSCKVESGSFFVGTPQIFLQKVEPYSCNRPQYILLDIACLARDMVCRSRSLYELPCLQIWVQFKNNLEYIKTHTGWYSASGNKAGDKAQNNVEQTQKDAASLAAVVSDSTKESYERMIKAAEGYYRLFFQDSEIGEKLRKEYLDELLLTRYPIIAYPIFPEPTYYYLKLMSEKFILPAVSEMSDNSVALFLSNATFEEAFLCGMNTEMGRELLWREYPTDQRGSCFRKFWDSDTGEDSIANGRYFDIKPVHAWDGELGSNHLESKAGLLIFAIKGKLLKQYPSTDVYLSKAEAAGKNQVKFSKDIEKGLGIIRPSMLTFLNEDIMLVGFDIPLQQAMGNPAKNDYGYLLTFEEHVEDLNFDTSVNFEGQDQAAAVAKALVNAPTRYGKHISLFLTNSNQ